MTFVYLASLLVSTGCMVLLDYRYRLAFFCVPLRAAAAVGFGLAFFLVWDAVGISLGVFRHLDSRWATGIMLGPEFPIEELFFLAFLTYLTLIVLTGTQRLIEVRRRR